MAKAQDPPSPVDAYQGAPAAVPIDGPEPPPHPSTQPPPYPPAYAPQPVYAPRRETNVLAIIALIASCAGSFIPLADVAGIVMGFIALGQIKKSGEGGHGLALAAVIVGFALCAIELLFVIAYIVFIVWIVGAAVSTANDYSSVG